MENLLVTGGCGFIGANFIHYLLTQPDFRGRIINVDLLTYAGNAENLAGIETRYPGRYQFFNRDICDESAMREIFDSCRVDSLCHFAAESHVDRSIVSPDAFIRTNIEGTFRLLELARERIETLRVFHHVSTDEVYGSLGATGFFTENTPYRPNSPYAASKAASDHLVRAYGKTYGLPITISNCSNNYGPYQFPEKLIPLMILNAKAGKALPVYGDGKNVRDWLYVEDHCEAIWRIMNAGQHGETYNIGGGCEMQNIEVVTEICDYLDEIQFDADIGARREQIAFIQDRPGHDRRYAIDYQKIQQELMWSPKTEFKIGLRKTIQWYLENSNWIRRVQSGEYRKWIQRQYGGGVREGR